MINSMNNSQMHIPQSLDTANTKLPFDIPDTSDTKVSFDACVSDSKERFCDTPFFDTGEGPLTNKQDTAAPFNTPLSENGTATACISSSTDNGTNNTSGPIGSASLPYPFSGALSMDDIPKPINSVSAYTKPEHPLIIVMHASVGSGHRSAANAIAQAFTLMRNESAAKRTDRNADSETAVQSENFTLENLEVEVLDVLDFGHIVFDGNKTASLFTGAARPIYDLTWRFNLTGRVLWGGGTIWNRLMYDPFTKYVSEKQPIAIICTHITAANVAVAARMITGQHFPIVCVPTDYEVEGLWPHSAADLFCVANESMAETLRPRKVNDERILITGIPTRDDFHHTYDRTAVRKALGLPLEKYNVLVLAGADLPRPYVRFRAALDKLLPYLHNFSTSLHFTFIAGSDKEYAQHVRREYEELCLANVTVLDYVNDMAALMAASDLAICKPGGLTVTECLCAQIPMLLVGKAYGQEKANVQMLTSLGAALHVTTPRELFTALCRIAYNPDVTRAMLVNASFLRCPQAARDIAAATLRLASSPKDTADSLYRKHFLHFYRGDKPAHTR